MPHLVLTALALGVAGFDPLGVVALIAAMALRARRAGVVALMLSTWVSTVIFGVVPALLLGPAVFRATHALRHVGHRVWGPLVVAIGVALLVWAVWRTLHPTEPATDADAGRAAPRSASPGALTVTGLLVGLSAFIDPAFYAGVAYAAHQPHAWQSVLVMVLWVSVSQSALIVVGLATLLGLYEPVHRVIVDVQTRWARPLGWVATAAIALAGIFCVVQGIAEWHGHWMWPLHHRPR